MSDDVPQSSQLKRRLSLPLLALYGLGTTIGAGIFVLVGKVTGAAGYAAPLSFLLASVMAGLTALAFAELAVRYPVSAGEAFYVKRGFGKTWLATLVGLLVALAGIVSAAAISRGFVGYVQPFAALDGTLLLSLLVLALVTLAVIGIAESVSVAAIFTVVETGALLYVVWLGRDALTSNPESWRAMEQVDLAAMGGVLTGAILAFYAFIGFEDMVNVAEEVRDEARSMPLAIVVTLILTTLVYLLVALTALAVATPAVLSESDAPIALIYEIITGDDALVISAVAALAVVNGALIQVIMASRVLYGLGRFSWLPRVLAQVNARTATPVLATLLAGLAVWGLAVSTPVVRLAEITSFTTLIIFALVNAALVRLKLRGGLPAVGFSLPVVVPIIGALVAVGFGVLQGLRFLGVEL